MSRQRKILYLIQAIPGDNAPTKHAFAIADLLIKIGFEVEFMVAGIASSDLADLSKPFGYAVNFPESLQLSRWRVVDKYHERLTSKRAVREFMAMISRSDYRAVVYYGIESELAEKVIFECRRRGVAVFVDETDWFDPSFNWDLAAWIVEKSRSKRVAEFDKDADGVIAISSYFKNHFEAIRKKEGRPEVFFLPPLNRMGDSLDASSLGVTNASNIGKRSCTKFFYAGSPAGGKDQLACFVSSLARVAELNPSTVPTLDVVGVSRDEAFELMGELSKTKGVAFHGRLPHGEVVQMLRAADFGILFRRCERYAKAGFSTKFAECMSNGVPMICNKVGGADKVIESGLDGIVLDDISAHVLEDGIKLACEMDDEKLASMKKAAHEKAMGLFEPDNYIESFGRYMNDVIDGAKLRS